MVCCLGGGSAERVAGREVLPLRSRAATKEAAVAMVPLDFLAAVVVLLGEEV